MLTRTAFRQRTLAPHISPFSTASYATASPHIESDSGDAVARPPTVPWSEHLHNSVTFTGTVEYPLKPFTFKYGQRDACATTMLLIKPRPTSTRYFRLRLSFWNLLAERALACLKPNDYICVSGQLEEYTKSTLEGTERLYYNVAVKELNYVEMPDESYFVAAESGLKAGESLEQKHQRRLPLWQSLFANPDEWHDYRKTTKNGNYPDFRHKKTGDCLWLNADDPSWVKEHMEIIDSRLTETASGEMPFGTLTFDCTSGLQLASSDLMKTNLSNPTHCSNIGESLEEKHMSRIALWQSLFANLDEWQDRRKLKKHWRQPDFIHKKTKEVLWLNPEDPSWVKNNLELLDSRLTETSSGRMPFGPFTSDCVSGHQLASSDST